MCISSPRRAVSRYSVFFFSQLPFDYWAQTGKTGNFFLVVLPVCLRRNVWRVVLQCKASFKKKRNYGEQTMIIRLLLQIVLLADCNLPYNGNSVIFEITLFLKLGWNVRNSIWREIVLRNLMCANKQKCIVSCVVWVLKLLLAYNSCFYIKTNVLEIITASLSPVVLLKSEALNIFVH